MLKIFGLQKNSFFHFFLRFSKNENLKKYVEFFENFQNKNQKSQKYQKKSHFFLEKKMWVFKIRKKNIQNFFDFHFFSENFLKCFFSMPKKNFFFSKLKKNLRLSSDAEKAQLSIGAIFRAIRAVWSCALFKT